MNIPSPETSLKTADLIGAVSPATAALQTYEDCVAEITAAEGAASPDDVKASLRKLKAFFTNRMARPSKSAKTAGFNATKSAIEGRRTFKKYEPEPTGEKPLPRI